MPAPRSASRLKNPSPVPARSTSGSPGTHGQAGDGLVLHAEFAAADRRPAAAAVRRLPHTTGDAAGVHPVRIRWIDGDGARASADVARSKGTPGSDIGHAGSQRLRLLRRPRPPGLRVALRASSTWPSRPSARGRSGSARWGRPALRPGRACAPRTRGAGAACRRARGRSGRGVWLAEGGAPRCRPGTEGLDRARDGGTGCRRPGGRRALAFGWASGRLQATKAPRTRAPPATAVRTHDDETMDGPPLGYGTEALTNPSLRDGRTRVNSQGEPAQRRDRRPCRMKEC